jgi:ABC-type transporter MlaC component
MTGVLRAHVNRVIISRHLRFGRDGLAAAAPVNSAVAGSRAIRTRSAAKYLLIALAALALPLRASAQTVAAIDAFVAQLGDGMRAIHAQAGGETEKLVAGCRDFLTRTLDVAAMAQAASEDAWTRMSAAQREDYGAGVAQRLAAECSRQLTGYKGDAVELMGIRATSGGDRLATFRLGAADSNRMIAWRLRAKSGQYRAVDVTWEGHSAVAKAREEFAAGLHGVNGNVDAFIESLKK